MRDERPSLHRLSGFVVAGLLLCAAVGCFESKKPLKYFGEADGRKFVIGLHMLPNLGKWFAPTSLVLSHAKKNVLATQEGRELSFERKRMGEYPGGVLMYAPLDEDAEFDVMQVHLVLVGQRLYILKASDPEQGDRSQVDRFFSSFEVIE